MPCELGERAKTIPDPRHHPARSYQPGPSRTPDYRLEPLEDSVDVTGGQQALPARSSRYSERRYCGKHFPSATSSLSGPLSRIF
ncbi:MAG: hypothetical protein L0215_19785, partial [Gemmataceae bacterium]|nr:hypothetical protein [Gemmataceae bacterium]